MAALWLHPIAPLSLMSLAFSAGIAVYAYAGLAPSNNFLLLWGWGGTFFTVAWAVADARRRCETPCFDFGQLVWQFYWLSIPWYCVRSRGWFGLLMLLILLGLYFLPSVVFMAVWTLVHRIPANLA